MEFFVTLCAFLLFLSIAVKSVKKTKPVNLPLGPRPLPIIGNMHQLNGSLPHRILTHLAKKYGPLMHLHLGEVSTVVVSSPAVAKEVMNDHDIIFAYRPFLLSPSILNYGCADIAFAPYGEYWRQLHKICTIELLSRRRVQTFRSIREEEVLNLIRSISSEEGSVVNLSKKIYSLTYSITAQAAFGKRSKYHDKFISIMQDVVKLMGGLSIADIYPSIKILERITRIRHKLEIVHNQVDEILENILSEHKVKRAESKLGNGEAKEDLVDVLLNIQKSGEFGAPPADYNLKAVIFDIFSAGDYFQENAVNIVKLMDMRYLPRPESLLMPGQFGRDPMEWTEPENLIQIDFLILKSISGVKLLVSSHLVLEEGYVLEYHLST